MKIFALALLAANVMPAAAHAQTPAMWAVRDDDTTIYLLGTVHSLDEGRLWFTGSIDAAYRQAGEVVLEASVSDAEATRATGLKYAASERRLRDLLPREKRRAMEAALAKSGAKKSALDGYDPWFANIILSTIALKDSPLKGHWSVDLALRQSGERDGKTVIYLESAADQFAAFDGIPIPAQLRQLEATIDNPVGVREGAEQIVRCWKVGDLTCVLAASERDIGSTPEVRDALLVHRNAKWAGYIAERMKQPGTVLVAVGVEHFVGAGSLLDQLAEHKLHPKRMIE